MKTFALYGRDGRIESTYMGFSSSDAHLRSSLFIECGHDVSDDTHYVDLSGPDPVIRKKSFLPVAHNADGLNVTFLSLPIGARVEVQGLELTADDEPTVIEFDSPGTYEIRIYPPPQYTDEVVEVTVG